MKLILLILFPFLLQAQDPFSYYRTDDFKHYQAGLLINGLGTSSVYFFTDNHKKALLFGNILSLGTTIGKELVYDKLMNRGVPSFPDAINGVFGNVLHSFIFVIHIDIKYKKQNKTI